MGFAREAQPHGLAAGDTRSGPQGPSPALWAGVKDTGRDEGQGSGCGGATQNPVTIKVGTCRGKNQANLGWLNGAGHGANGRRASGPSD
ncbi:hypothetical protein ACFX13_015280 [Malus domestica]